MASAAVAAQPAVASRQLRLTRRIQITSISARRRVAYGAPPMAARPGLPSLIMRKRWRLAPWLLLLQVQARFTSARVNSIHAVTVSLASDFIELMMPPELRR